MTEQLGHRSPAQLAALAAARAARRERWQHSPEVREQMAARKRAWWAARRAGETARTVNLPAIEAPQMSGQPDVQASSVARQPASDVDGMPQTQRYNGGRDTRLRALEAQRLDAQRRARVAVKAKMQDGTLQQLTTLHYRCRRGHTWEYTRQPGTPWSNTSEACYSECPAVEWQRRVFPAEHPTRAGQVEQRGPRVGTQAVPTLP